MSPRTGVRVCERSEPFAPLRDTVCPLRFLSDLSARNKLAAKMTGMENLADAVLESWDRQCKIMTKLAANSEGSLPARPSYDGWPIGEHLCHVHGTRRFWLSKAAPEFDVGMESLYTKEGDEWIPSMDLPQIQGQLEKSALQIRKAMERLLAAEPAPTGGYDHPVLFLQHMIWHEGWHAGLIMLALRLAGREPTEEWEEANIWGLWRTE